MTVNDIYVLIQYIVNKNQQGYLSPSQFNTVINQGQRSYATYLLGRVQDYMPTRPMSKVEFGNNSVIRQRLSPIIYGYNLTVDGNGYSPYPSDYLQTDAMLSIYGFNRVRFVEQDSLYAYYNSSIDPIATNPIYLIQDTGFQFYPTTTANAKLSYVRNPPDMVWGYTDDLRGRPVYSEAHSTQPVWDDASLFEIVVRALAMVGVNLQASSVSQFAEQIKKGGE